MCTVLLRFTPGGPVPVLLGAVRDEFVERAWDLPAAHWGGHLLGGRDRTAGGTWLAVDLDRPAVAAVLNGFPRAPSTVDNARPSRGGLPLAVLRGEQLPGPDRYDGFHLVLATLTESRVWSWDGNALVSRQLEPGDHIIVNEGIDPADHPLAGKLPDAEQWQRLLGDGVVLVDGTHAGRRYGSTSTSLLRLTPTSVRYQFNPWPRDPSGWYDVIEANPLP
jgi:uncharacterized protein with NRDE domain